MYSSDALMNSRDLLPVIPRELDECCCEVIGKKLNGKKVSLACKQIWFVLLKLDYFLLKPENTNIPLTIFILLKSGNYSF